MRIEIFFICGRVEAAVETWDLAKKAGQDQDQAQAHAQAHSPGTWAC